MTDFSVDEYSSTSYKEFIIFAHLFIESHHAKNL